MPNCVICNREVSKGLFNTKDKFELTNHSFICKTCASKIGIKNIWSAAAYTAEKAKAKYFELYPDETGMRRNKEYLDDAYILDLCDRGLRLQALQYVKETAALGTNDASCYIDRLLHSRKSNLDDEFIAKLKAIPNSDTTWTTKEQKYLRTILSDDEEVLHVVSGVMQQNHSAVSGNIRTVGTSNSNSSRTWLMALTNRRIVLINRHLLVGMEYTEIPLEAVNSVSFQTRVIASSISIMHGSDGILIDNIVKGTEKPFVEKANAAIREIRNGGSKQTVNVAAHSAADELAKWHTLLQQGIITQEEFDAQKAKLLR